MRLYRDVVYETHACLERNFKGGSVGWPLRISKKREELKELHDSFSKQTTGNRLSPPLCPFFTMLKWHHSPPATSQNTARSSLSRCPMPLGTLTEAVWNRQCYTARLTTSKNHRSTHNVDLALLICISATSQFMTVIQGHIVWLSWYCLHQLQFASLPSNPLRMVILTWRFSGGFTELLDLQVRDFPSIMVVLIRFKWWLAEVWYR